MPFPRTTGITQVTEHAISAIETVHSPFGPRSVTDSTNANGRYRGRPVDNCSAITSRCKHAAEIRPSCTICTLSSTSFSRPTPEYPSVLLQSAKNSSRAILSFEYYGKSSRASSSIRSCESRYVVSVESEIRDCVELRKLCRFICLTITLSSIIYIDLKRDRFKARRVAMDFKEEKKKETRRREEERQSV